MDYNFVSVFGDKKLKILIVFLLCISLSEAHNLWKFQSFNTTLNRVKRQNCGFTCDNGDCISNYNLCDGTVECADGSDETEKQCSGIPCPSFLFRCDYGPCINKKKICDGIKDCADNSDENGEGCSTGSSACSPSEFRCQNNDCIDGFAVCDGRADCKDGSDETAETCKGNVCSNFLIKCNYGACVDRNARCNGIKECADGSDEFGCPGNKPSTPPVTPDVPVVTPPTDVTVPSGGCRLLNHPPNGRRFLNSSREYVPNNPVVQSTVIGIKCNDNYLPTDLNNKGVAFCINGQWLGDTAENICQRTCPPINDPTITTTCLRDFKTINCNEAVEGAQAVTKCKPFYTYGPYESRPRMECTNGDWMPRLGSCVPVCGVKKVNAQTLIIGGSKALPGEYPWIVAIYNQENTHICGGSIISRRYVLSAAHCFSDLDNGDVYDKNLYTLVAGKYHRKIDDERDKDMQQIRNIENLIVHEYYKGRIRNYQYDIAVLKVNKEFELGIHVQPVCMDWDDRYEAISLTDGNEGVVAGWGYTSEGSDPAAELKKVILPFQSASKCEKYLPHEFYNVFYTPDKICAGYIDKATTVCSGDSGGGYYFQSDTRFYIRGIVSLSPTSKVGCNKELYALYTKVSMYRSWLEDKTGKYV